MKSMIISRGSRTKDEYGKSWSKHPRSSCFQSFSADRFTFLVCTIHNKAHGWRSPSHTRRFACWSWVLLCTASSLITPSVLPETTTPTPTSLLRMSWKTICCFSNKNNMDRIIRYFITFISLRGPSAWWLSSFQDSFICSCSGTSCDQFGVKSSSLISAQYLSSYLASVFSTTVSISVSRGLSVCHLF